MGSNSSTGSEASTAFITEAIKSNQVTIFSKSYCPYCIKTKNTFAGLENVTIKAYELVCNSKDELIYCIDYCMDNQHDRGPREAVDGILTNISLCM